MLAESAKLDVEMIDVCEYFDHAGLNEYEQLITLLILERAWGVDFNAITLKEQITIVNEHLHQMEKIKTGVTKLEEAEKQRTRSDRLGIVPAPTPAEVKNKAIKHWIDKVSVKVAHIKSFQDLVKMWWKSGNSKMMTEVFDQWIIKNRDQLTAFDEKTIDFVKGSLNVSEFISYVPWCNMGVGDSILRIKI